MSDWRPTHVMVGRWVEMPSGQKFWQQRSVTLEDFAKLFGTSSPFGLAGLEVKPTNEGTGE
jgi:hypothetical protein